MENTTKSQLQVSFEQNKNKWLVGGGVLVLVILGLIIFLSNRASAPESLVEGCKEGDLFSQTTGEPCEGEVEACKEGDIYDINTGELCAGAGDKAIFPKTVSGYDAALKEYEGKSVLFDAQCVPQATSLDALVGSKVLIANNGDKPLAISFLNRNVNLTPYHYMTSFLGTAGEFVITCDGQPAATVVAK